MTSMLNPAAGRLSWSRDLAYWVLAVCAFFVFPRDLSLGTSILITSLFVLSLDLVLGFAGVVSFGHAVFFGIGAYAAALLVLAGYREPISGALIAAAVAAVFALIISPVVLRVSGLPQIMVTLAFGVIVFEFANKAVWLTKGDDGIGGLEPLPLLGFFRWTAFGTTQYWYALLWLLVVFVGLRRFLASPLGLAVQGCRENPQRMQFIGGSVINKLRVAYVLGGAIAGLAGAISAQTTKFAGLDSLSVDRSIDALVMLILGGTGRLYGALIGTPIYMIVRQFAAQWNPFHWMFVVGGLLVVIVMLARGGVVGLLQQARGHFARAT